MKSGQKCRVISGTLSGIIVDLLYRAEDANVWRVYGQGSQMWFRSDEIEVVEICPLCGGTGLCDNTESKEADDAS